MLKYKCAKHANNCVVAIIIIQSQPFTATQTVYTGSCTLQIVWRLFCITYTLVEYIFHVVEMKQMSVLTHTNTHQT
jgi:hypothetical protein